MSSWGKDIRISVFGESHGAGVGVVVDAPPPGVSLDMDRLLLQMKRRAPGRDKAATPRKEDDLPEILSGLQGNVTTGAPLCALIRNTNTRSQDYGNLLTSPRPAHADYTGYIRYHGFNDIRGGGHFSARLTAPLVFAGAVCRQILEKKGISSAAHIASIGHICDSRFNETEIADELMQMLSESTFGLIDRTKESEMRALIEECRMDGDSIGGTIECAVKGMPAGSALRGSQNNDAFYYDGDMVRTRTNHHGGILGGISSGMPIIFRTAMKPTPSIAKEQHTVNLMDKTDTTLAIKGRHDPCIVVRAVPVIESVTAIALVNLLKDVNML